MNFFFIKHKLFCFLLIVIVFIAMVQCVGKCMFSTLIKLWKGLFKMLKEKLIRFGFVVLIETLELIFLIFLLEINVHQIWNLSIQNYRQ